MPDITQLVRGSGYAYWNPVSQANLGINLGYIEGGIFTAFDVNLSEVYFETTGAIPQMYIYLGMKMRVFAKFLNVQNPTTLQRAFLQTVSSVPSVETPGTLKTGTNILPGATSGSFIFIPEDASQPCFYSSSCVGVLPPSAKLVYMRKKCMDVPVMFLCANHKIDLLSNLLAG